MANARKLALKWIMPRAESRFRYLDHTETRGVGLFRAACERDLECRTNPPGVVSPVRPRTLRQRARRFIRRGPSRYWTDFSPWRSCGVLARIAANTGRRRGTTVMSGSTTDRASRWTAWSRQLRRCAPPRCLGARLSWPRWTNRNAPGSSAPTSNDGELHAPGGAMVTRCRPVRPAAYPSQPTRMVRMPNASRHCAEN
jgi:hypothetical protein